MKKLFLYIAFFGFIFWACFIITRDFFQNKEYSHSYTLLSDDEREKLQRKKDGGDNGNNASLSHAVGASVRFSGAESHMLEDVGGYIVTIDNQYIVVYESDGQSVFEYTEIDADLIKTLNYDLYERLLEGIHFNTPEDIYRFLETISS